MKRLIILLLLAPFLCMGQNLVDNPDFEDKFTPAFGYDEIAKAYGWDAANIDPWHGSPELFSGELNTFQGVLTPGANHYGYIEPRVSPLPWASPMQNGCLAGVVLYSDSGQNARTLLAGDLDATLQQDVTYYFSMDLALASKSSCAAQIGIRLYPDDIGQGGGMFGGEVARLSHPLTDTTWVSFAGSFTPASPKRGFTIGNHHTDANTYVLRNSHSDSLAADSLGLHWQPWKHQMAYMYIDNVCISAYPSGCATSTLVPPVSTNRHGFVLYPEGWGHSSGKEVTLFSMGGQMLNKGKRLPVPDMPGVYILRCGDACHKVIR